MGNIDLKNFITKNIKQISICACDAGASEHIYAWTKNSDFRINYCLDGPALKIFMKEGKKIKNQSLEECLKGSDLHIAGTAWSSDLEIYSTIKAKEKSIYTISVLDHWVSYRERFIYKDKLVLPDEVWVSDETAKGIISNLFPELKVSLLPNLWMNNLKNKVNYYSSITEREREIPGTNILYLLEPIKKSDQWNTQKNEKCEFDALRYFFDNLKILQKLNLINNKKDELKIRFRLHPSEEKFKYSDFLTQFKSLINYSISCSQNLEQDLAWCDVALGIETQALICALECGITSISCKPLWAGECNLPHKKLLKISTMK